MVGDKVAVTKYLDGRGKDEEARLITKEGIIIQETEYFTTVKFKDYTESFNRKKYGGAGARIKCL